MKPDPPAPRIETRRTVRRGERTIDVRVVEYPATRPRATEARA